MSVQVPILRLPHGRDLPLPAYATPGAAGLDLCAAVQTPVMLDPLARALIPTGFAIALPAGMEAQIRPRSGLALKQGLTVLNSPGTVDSDYRGEVGVILANLSDEPARISRGDRIAQMVIADVVHVELEERQDLPQTDRGVGGFGSTGR
ncbi:MAG: dUTP diphosphatase [Rhodothalassiaceae bacterium]